LRSFVSARELFTPANINQVTSTLNERLPIPVGTKSCAKATKACKFLRFIREKLETGEYFNYIHALSQQSGTFENSKWESL
jgi:hypothetical protein